MGSVSVEQLGDVVVLRLDSGKLNVLSTATVKELRAQVREAASSSEVQALVLVGRTGAFSAGLDLGVLAQGGTAAQELFVELAELLVELYGNRLRVVAACTGHAVAAGAMLLLVSDVRVGAEGDFRIGFSEVARGLPVPEIPVLLARDRLTPRLLQGLLLTGRLLGPRDAVEAGFLDRTLPADLVYDAALDEARGLAKLSADAYMATLNNVRGGVLREMQALLEVERKRLG